MKLSPEASRKANVCAWNPASLDEQSSARLRYQPSAGRPGAAVSETLAESLFAPALSDDFTSHEQAAAPTEDSPSDAAQPAQNWLLNELGQPRPMEDCCENWIPGEIHIEPVGVKSAQAAPDVEGIRDAALSVARAAVLETMRQEAEQILTQAREQAAEALNQARQAAEDELRRARQEGLAAARAQAESMLQMLATTVAETQSWQENLMRHGERLTITLVQEIAARLFGDGFVLDPATLSLTFERSLAEAKSLGDLRLRAHPDDLALLGELWPAHQTALRGQHIELIPDMDIQRGGCFIDGQFGSVDGRLDAQLRLVRERLSQELSDSERPEKGFVPLNPEELSA